MGLGRVGGDCDQLVQQAFSLGELAAIDGSLGAGEIEGDLARTIRWRGAARGGGAITSGAGACRSMTSATTRRRASGVIGLVRKSIAPSFMASTASGMLPWAVRITTGTAEPSARSRRKSSMPSILGIKRSSTTRSHAVPAVLEPVERGGAVLGLDHLDTGLTSRAVSSIEPHVRLVVNDQDAVALVHCLPPSTDEPNRLRRSAE